MKSLAVTGIIAIASAEYLYSEHGEEHYDDSHAHVDHHLRRHETFTSHEPVRHHDREYADEGYYGHESIHSYMPAHHDTDYYHEREPVHYSDHDGEYSYTGRHGDAAHERDLHSYEGHHAYG